MLTPCIASVRTRTGRRRQVRENNREMHDFAASASVLQNVAASIARVMRGQQKATRRLLAAFASGGHVLLEDYPGTGKTTLAKALARSVAAEFQRIQFTPDLLPTDILGVSIYDPERKEFRFHHGPVFSHILLADEINRASPRTQSALLEAMAEGQVTVEGSAYPLDDIFFVVATQNPVELHGTYPLPEAQMDRFALRFELGYVELEQEVVILSDQRDGHPLDTLSACVSRAEVARAKQAAAHIRVSEELKVYISELVRATRGAEGVSIGASPRGALALMKTAQALALLDGVEFVTPDHVQELAVPAIAHRLVMDPQARFSGRTPEAVVQEILEQIPVPL